MGIEKKRGYLMIYTAGRNLRWHFVKSQVCRIPGDSLDSLDSQHS